MGRRKARTRRPYCSKPLDEQESGELLDNLLGHHELAAIRHRVAEAAEGNPLFVEEMLAMLIDDGILEPVNGSWVASADPEAIAVPPTIQALLSARLERLGEPERAVVECASVEGKVFHRGAVAQLVGGPIEGCLQGLVRKELVRPDRSELPGEDAFKFRHLLFRDAAYESDTEGAPSGATCAVRAVARAGRGYAGG